MFFLKFLVYFTLSFVIMAIPTSTTSTVFDSMNFFMKPYTSKIYRKAAFYLDTSLEEGTHVGKSLLNNTSKSFDQIRNGSSSVRKKTSNVIESSDLPPSHDYTREEREALLRVLKQ